MTVPRRGGPSPAAPAARGKHWLALVVAILAAAALLALGTVGLIANRLTPRETIGGCVAIFVGAIAALWLRREARQHGGRHRQ